MTVFKWVGPRPPAVCAGFKSMLPCQPYETIVRVDFAFERVYCKLNGAALVLKDGQLMPIATVFCQDMQPMMGKSDPYQVGCSHTPEGRRFLEALLERERLNCAVLMKPFEKREI